MTEVTVLDILPIVALILERTIGQDLRRFGHACVARVYRPDRPLLLPVGLDLRMRLTVLEADNL